MSSLNIRGLVQKPLGGVGRLPGMLVGLVLLLQGAQAPASPLAAAPAHLIYAGWFGNTVPTPGFIANNLSFLESQPFDGLVVYLRNDANGYAATQSIVSTTPVSYQNLATILAPLQGLGFAQLRDNFALVQAPNPPDFFDDWSVPIQNYANLARALGEAGLRGVFFDNEQYSRAWANYPVGVKYPARTLGEYQVQASLRGTQVMQAMVAQFPQVQVLQMHGPYVSEPQAPSPLFPTWWTQNQLLGPYFSGFVQGAGPSALNIDGGELYTLRTADQFLGSYNWRKYNLPSDAVNCAFIPPALRPPWPGMVSVSFGLYDSSFGGVAMTPDILRPTLTSALHQADRYVWFYTEGRTFLLPPGQGGATSDWVGSIQQAKADAGAGVVPLTTSAAGPAAPSHLLVTSQSSTEVDLSWWDMSSDESGFAVERRTGADGTWAQVLLTGANVSAMNDIGLSPGTLYSYRTRAVNPLGASAYSNELSVTTSGVPAGPPPDGSPAAPSHLTVPSMVPWTVSLMWWDMSSDETAFEVERKTGAQGSWGLLWREGANVSVHDDGSVERGLTYSYRVRAVSDAGASAYSNEVTVTAP